MSRTISVSGVPKRVFQYLVAGVVVYVVVLFGGESVVAVLRSLGVVVSVPAGVTGLGLFTLLWVGLTVLWVRRMRGWEGSDSVWEPIAREQYLGRNAELGGIARHDWENPIDQLSDGDDD